MPDEEKKYPLGLPEGSVRAIIALSLTGTVIVATFIIEADVDMIKGAAVFIWGYYFGKKGGV